MLHKILREYKRTDDVFTNYEHDDAQCDEIVYTMQDDYTKKWYTTHVQFYFFIELKFYKYILYLKKKM